jgi:hypothetical protein
MKSADWTGMPSSLTCVRTPAASANCRKHWKWPVSRCGGIPPGVLPAVYNAPPAVAAFTGREALLGQLREALRSDPRPVVVQAVHGLGGVGKTALVLQYLHATANLYRLIWWIDAQQPIRIGEQLAALGSRAGWVPAGVQLATAIDLTRQWLLVFDNATSPDDL